MPRCPEPAVGHGPRVGRHRDDRGVAVPGVPADRRDAVRRTGDADAVPDPHAEFGGCGGRQADRVVPVRRERRDDASPSRAAARTAPRRPQRRRTRRPCRPLPAAARPCTMPTGTTRSTPADVCQPTRASRPISDSPNDGCPSDGCCSTSRSPAGRARRRRSATPTRRSARRGNPTSRVMRATTEPMSTKRPRANRRSRQATNTVVSSRSWTLHDLRPSVASVLPTVIAGSVGPGIELPVDPARTGRPYAVRDMAHSTLNPVFVGLRTGLHVLSAALLALVVVRIVVVGRPDRAARGRARRSVRGRLPARGGRRPHGRVPPGPRRRALGRRTERRLGRLLVLVPRPRTWSSRSSSCTCTSCPRRRAPQPWSPRRRSRGRGARPARRLHGRRGGRSARRARASRSSSASGTGRSPARPPSARPSSPSSSPPGPRLAATEREQGVLAERARLAREIQRHRRARLSSIQMRCTQPTRADGDRPGPSTSGSRRETAADGLATPVASSGSSRPRRSTRGSAPRSAGSPSSSGRATGSRSASPSRTSPCRWTSRTALLRLAQGRVANAVQHARAAAHVDVVVAVDGREARLTVVDRRRRVRPGHHRRRAAANGLLRPPRDGRARRAVRRPADGRECPGRGTTITAVLEVP